MKTVLQLVLKDLRRDYKRPWTLLIFSALPLFMTALMAAVFGRGGDNAALPTVRVAVLDQDKDMLSRFLRSLPTQGEAAQRLRLRFVESREEGVRLLRQREASAFLVLPHQLTERLLDGATNTLELYENPAEQILPKIVRQGVSLLATGLSAAAEVLREPLRDIRAMTQQAEFPAEAAVAGAASGVARHLGHLRAYVFPPLIRFETLEASRYQIRGEAPSPTPTP